MIGLGGGAAFDHISSDAGAGTVALKTLLKGSTQIVFAGGHSRRR